MLKRSCGVLRFVLSMSLPGLRETTWRPASCAARRLTQRGSGTLLRCSRLGWRTWGTASSRLSTTSAGCWWTRSPLWTSHGCRQILQVRRGACWETFMLLVRHAPISRCWGGGRRRKAGPCSRRSFGLGLSSCAYLGSSYSKTSKRFRLRFWRSSCTAATSWTTPYSAL